jgi:hypothetical protein
MRTAIVAILACGAVCVAPLAFGGIIVTALAVTLAGATGAVSVSPCSGTEPVGLGSGLVGDIDGWVAREVPGSPLTGIGAALVAGAAGSGLDPRVLAAIALQETRLGTAGGGPAVHNPFGLGPGLAFPTWAAAIALAVHTLQSMHAAGAQTIAEIAVHWAPVGAANDPTGLNANWIGGVSAAYAALGGDPARAVFASNTARACPRTTGPGAP